MKKKILSAILALSITGAVAVPAFAFTDMDDPAYAWAQGYVNAMNEGGYISGYEDNTFRPDNQVTRLECLALFARAMGSKKAENESVLALAHEDYDALIKNYTLSWGTDEIAYLLYKGVLKKADLDTYLLGTEKDTPMQRYEAAIIITKALNGEADALAQNGIVLDYTDAREIPSVAVQYVNYVTKEGVMTGMGDGTFSPTSSVSRAQMAVMLSRTVDKTGYTFIKGHLESVSTEDKTVTYTVNGEAQTIPYSDATAMKVLGTITQPRIMTVNVQAVFTLSNGELISVDALSDVPDETIAGVYKGYSTSAGSTFVKITVNGEVRSYECAKDMSVTYAGGPSTLRSFVDGDAVTISLTDGKISYISGNEKEYVVKNAIVEDITIDNQVTIRISSAEADYDGKTYTVASDVVVTKNNMTSDLSDIYVGDTVNVTLRYNEITKIVASSVKKNIEGTISSLTIAGTSSSMVVNVKGVETEYTIPADVTILINGETGSLYDFRVGDAVKLTTESNAITKITATSTQTTQGNVTGVVTGVNASYGFIMIMDDAGQTTTVFCKDNTTKFMTMQGVSKSMSAIKEGQTVNAMGTVSNGAFAATLVIITADK